MNDMLWTLSRVRRHQKAIRRMGADIMPRITWQFALLALAAALLLWTSSVLWACAEGDALYRVNVKDGSWLNFREEPSLKAKPVWQLSNQSTVRVIETRDDWALCEWTMLDGLNNHPRAWAMNKYLEEEQ